MQQANIVERTTTGDITTASARLFAVILKPGSADSSVVVKRGGSGGTTILTLTQTIVANASSVASGDLHGALCSGGIHVTLSGTGAAVTVVYS
jgi:hypothetical protein